MGLHTLRGRGRLLRVLDEGRGGPTTEDVTTEEGDFNREAEEESGAGSGGGRGGDGRSGGSDGGFGYYELSESTEEGIAMNLGGYSSACRPYQG